MGDREIQIGDSAEIYSNGDLFDTFTIIDINYNQNDNTYMIYLQPESNKIIALKISLERIGFFGLYGIDESSLSVKFVEKPYIKSARKR